jgi:hypothetical protein
VPGLALDEGGKILPTLGRWIVHAEHPTRDEKHLLCERHPCVLASLSSGFSIGVAEAGCKLINPSLPGVAGLALG